MHSCSCRPQRWRQRQGATGFLCIALPTELQAATASGKLPQTQMPAPPVEGSELISELQRAVRYEVERSRNGSRAPLSLGLADSLPHASGAEPQDQPVYYKGMLTGELRRDNETSSDGMPHRACSSFGWCSHTAGPTAAWLP